MTSPVRQRLRRFGAMGAIGAIALVGCTVQPPTSTPAPEPTLTPAEPTGYAPPSNIDRSGTHDVTAPLQAFLNSVPNGSLISFPAGARYRIEGTLTLWNKRSVTVDGNGALFFATTAGTDPLRAQWQTVDGDDVELRELVVKGAHPNGGANSDSFVVALEGQHGIKVLGTSNVEVHHNTITDVYGDFVYLGRGATSIRNAYVHHNTGRRNGRSGMSIVAGSNITLAYNDVADVARATFNLETHPDWLLDGVRIASNQVGTGRLNFVAAVGDGVANNVVIEDNVLTGKPMNMQFAAQIDARRTGLTIQRNRSDTLSGNPSYYNVKVANYDNVVVRDNVQPFKPYRGMYLVGSINSCNVQVYNNTLLNSAGQLLIVKNTYPCP